MPTEPFDVLVIGAGIAGASLAWRLAPYRRVAVLERESQPGYHSTGRSAALFIESYGTAQVRALTMGSRSFFDAPPAGFAEHPLLTPRGTLIVAQPGQQALLDEHLRILHSVTANALALDADQTCARFPVLRRERVLGGALEPSAADIDVHTLHQGFLRGMRHQGAALVCNAEVTSIEYGNGHWQVRAGDSRYEAPVLVNAAGAWADEIAVLAGVTPLGLQPKRRSAFVFPLPPGLDAHAWPAAMGATEDWYLKPDAGMMLGSPANADPVAPHDVQPEEIDIALGIARIEEMTTLQIRRPTRTWAGLRSFVRDGDLVGGFDAAHKGFFWLAAQGGYGIQTAPAMSEACAAMLLERPWPEELSRHGLSPSMLRPDRLQRAADNPGTHDLHS